MSYYVTCPNCNTKIEVLGYFNNESNNYVIFCNSCCKEFEATYVDGEIKVKKEENMEELKYKVGDEVLIKGKVVNIYGPGDGSYPYRIKFDFDELAVTSTDIFTESCIVGTVDEFVKVGENQKTYEQGLNDAWEMAKLICMTINKGGLPTEQLEDIYDGYDLIDDIMETFCAQRAINKYNEWKERNSIKMGDIVEYDVAGGCERAIFYSEGPQVWWLLREGLTEPLYVCKEDFKLRKVGESGLDIADAFAKIREMEV